MPSGIPRWFRFDPFSSGGASLDPEENRAFLQKRIAFFARLGAAFVLATYLALVLAQRLDAGREETPWLGAYGVKLLLPGKAGDHSSARTGASRRRAWSTSCARSAARWRRPTESASSTATSSPRTSSSASAAECPTWPRWWTSASSATFYLLTGHPVFDGRSLVEVCGHHLHSAPEPPSRRAGIAIAPGLEACVLECLEKDPSRRPQTARALGERLAAAGVAAWTEDDARAWWAARGSIRAAPVPPTVALSESMTVDVAGRLG